MTTPLPPRSSLIEQASGPLTGAPVCRHVLGQRVDVTSYAEVTQRVLAWARAEESRYICCSNVHMVMEGCDAKGFREVVNAADLITPDGMPLVWCLRALGSPDARRVYGPTLTVRICEAAGREQVPVGLYGGTPESLELFCAFLQDRCPGIRIACRIAPPFRVLSDTEKALYARQIADSGAKILFVGLGCPKQEKWMAAHKGRLNMPMVGVGAAFDFHSGRVRQAPPWMQRAGLEWLFRLMMEPRRLWKRYAWHNPRFMLGFAIQYTGCRLRRKRGGSRVQDEADRRV